MISALLKGLIRFYRRCISPALGPHCRYTPTCSQYALEAIDEWGVIIGCTLAVSRIIRCNPFCRGGEDSVPRRLHPEKR